jgi:hypothetical protein
MLAMPTLAAFGYLWIILWFSEIDIWLANLMLKRYGDAALVESARRADELAAAGATRLS